MKILWVLDNSLDKISHFKVLVWAVISIFHNVANQRALNDNTTTRCTYMFEQYSDMSRIK